MMMSGSRQTERDHIILSLDQAMGLLSSKENHQGWPPKTWVGPPLVYKPNQWSRPRCFPWGVCKPTCRSTLYLQKPTVMSPCWLHRQQQNRENQSWSTHGNTLRSYLRCQNTTVMELCTHFWDWQMFLRTHLHAVLFLIWQILEATEFPLSLTQGSTDWVRVFCMFFSFKFFAQIFENILMFTALFSLSVQDVDTSRLDSNWLKETAYNNFVDAVETGQGRSRREVVILGCGSFSH